MRLNHHENSHSQKFKNSTAELVSGTEINQNLKNLGNVGLS